MKQTRLYTIINDKSFCRYCLKDNCVKICHYRSDVLNCIHKKCECTKTDPSYEVIRNW